jgi:hypothetical protein
MNEYNAKSTAKIMNHRTKYVKMMTDSLVGVSARKRLQNTLKIVLPHMFGDTGKNCQNLSQNSLPPTGIRNIYYPKMGKMSCQGRTETCGRSGQGNNLAPLQTDILKKFVQYLFSGGGEN